VDVRGTRFEEREEYFHVFRSFAPRVLDGLEWRRGDILAARTATDRLLERMASMRGHADVQRFDRQLRTFELNNDCAGCHVPNKAERHERASGELSDGMPNRGTDGGGLFSVATVLRDDAPLETHRARDMNEGDPYMTITRKDGRAARFDAQPRRRQYVCEDDSVPYGHLDVSSALVAGDEHAKAVCKSRAYLAEHMDDAGKSAFVAVLSECSGSDPKELSN
jgi:hypothetical protein